jgi:hypothetical protein
MVNIGELYRKHHSTSADEALRRAMERAAENASRIADVQRNLEVERMFQRSWDAAAAFTRKLDEVRRGHKTDELCKRVHDRAGDISELVWGAA